MRSVDERHLRARRQVALVVIAIVFAWRASVPIGATPSLSIDGPSVSAIAAAMPSPRVAIHVAIEVVK